MEATEIRRSVHALLQEVVHYHMVNAHKGLTIQGIADRLEGYYPIAKEANITYITLHTTDIVGCMGGSYDPETIAVATVTIANKVTIMATRQGVDIKVSLDDGEITPVYDYKKLIDDVHKYLGTGREIDLASYDVARVIRDIEKES